MRGDPTPRIRPWTRPWIRWFVLMVCLAPGLPLWAEAPASWTLASCPEDPLTEAWKKTVESGCKVKAAEGLLPLLPRLLRNVPFALRGHPFKSPDLRAFFTGHQGACATPWYAPGKARVKLPAGAELRCVQRLKKVEKTLHDRTPIPRAAETFVLENMKGEVIAELARLTGTRPPGNRGTVKKRDSGWEITFYSKGESAEDEPAEESATTVRCNTEGTACQVFFAG